MSDIGDKKLSELDDSVVKLGEYVVRVQLARRTGEIDVAETIELITRAKGPRSINQFSDVIGVSPSSLFRIINGSVTKLRAPMLAKIAFYADPESGVTLEQLMKAQGLSDPQDRMLTAIQYEHECRRIFIDALIQRGYMVKDLFIENKRDEFDFELTTDALKNGSGKWAVECKFLSRYSNALPAGIGRSRIALERAMACFYIGKSDYQRISLVVDHPVIFEQLKLKLSVLEIPNEISVILLNTDKGIIEDEYVAPLTCNARGYQEAVFGRQESTKGGPKEE